MIPDDELPPEDDGFDLQKFLPKKWYDFLKGLAAPILPALATLVLALGVSNGSKIAGAITAVAAFLGVLTAHQSKKFQKATNVGDVVVMPKEGGGMTYSLDLSVPPEKIQHLDQVTFCVQKGSPQE